MHNYGAVVKEISYIEFHIYAYTDTHTYIHRHTHTHTHTHTKYINDDTFLWYSFISRYMLLEVYKKRDEFNPKCKTVLINTESSQAVGLPKGLSLVNMSDCGKYCLLTPHKANIRKGKRCACLCVCVCVCA